MRLKRKTTGPYKPRKIRQVLPRTKVTQMEFNVERASRQAKWISNAAKKGKAIDVRALANLLHQVRGLKVQWQQYKDKMSTKRTTMAHTPGIIAGVRYHTAKDALRRAERYVRRLEKLEEKLSKLKDRIESV